MDGGFFFFFSFFFWLWTGAAFAVGMDGTRMDGDGVSQSSRAGAAAGEPGDCKYHHGRNLWTMVAVERPICVKSPDWAAGRGKGGRAILLSGSVLCCFSALPSFPSPCT